jgi:Nucleoside-diphosphate-sugar pyrophosphorylase involved in lipopolysaccharide biosynthesis/translation initiation factor 2B, gamma/epsilon subunits (eIF-2Bgamma/eIF-2Bepsilon)
MLTGFILAAGFGTRLRPLTDHLPKALISVCGSPLLQRALEFYERNGIKRIGVNSHHLPELIEGFKNNSAIPFKLFHESGAIRGTGGALLFARDFLSALETFCICNVDIIADVNLASLYETFLSHDCICGLIAVPQEKDGSIYYGATTKEYCGARTERPAAEATAEFIGMAFYKKEFLKIIAPEDFSIVPVWKRARQLGHSVKVLEVPDACWKDTGTPRALAQIHFDVLEKRLSLSAPSDLTVDFDNKRAYPKTFSSNEISALGRDVWCEASNIPDGVFLEKCVVLRGAKIPVKEHVKNVLITPWGEMEIL